MKIKVNGEEKKIELDQENALLSTVLNSMGYKPNTIIVELNHLIIKLFNSTTIVLGLYPIKFRALDSRAFS